MPSLRLKIADFLELVEAPPSRGDVDLEVVTALALENLSFLKTPGSKTAVAVKIVDMLGEEVFVMTGA